MTQNATARIRTIVLVAVIGSLFITACAADALTNGADPEDAASNTIAQADATVTPFPTAAAAARPTFVVQRGTVQDFFEFNARWLPRDQEELSFEVAGDVRRVEVRRNDTINRGDLIADLQIDQLENQLQDAKLNLETVRFQLESGSEGSLQSVIDAQFNLANARIDYENASQIDWTNVANAQIALQDSLNNLADAQRNYDNVISDPNQAAGDGARRAWEQLRDARSAVQRSQNNYFSAAQAYNEQKTGLRRTENNLLQLELALQDAVAGGGQDFEQVQRVRQAEIDVAQIEEQIAQSSLFSPIDGVVLEVSIGPGDPVRAFDPVITVARPEPLEAIAENLPFNDIQRVSVGDIGICQIANRPETAVQCIVRSLPLSSSDADQSVRVAASLDDAPLGQGIQVTMPLEVREDVLWLPPQAIRTFQTRTFVVVLREDGEVPLDVQIGLQTDERVEIISGVEEGDIVISP